MTAGLVSSRNALDFVKWGAWRRVVCRLLLPLGLAALLAPASGQPQSTQSRPFIMAADVPADSYIFRWSTLIYAEAFRRLGIPLEMVSYNLARRSALVEEGPSTAKSRGFLPMPTPIPNSSGSRSR